MRRYLKFIHNVNNIPKVCILPNMTMLSLIRTLYVALGGSTLMHRSAEGLTT